MAPTQGHENVRGPAEVDIGGDEVVGAVVIADVLIMLDEGVVLLAETILTERQRIK
jgi:hypothetical protein